MNSERYNRVMNCTATSKEDIKAFARNLLLECEVDIDFINIKEDGIGINSFSKLIKALYDAGFQEGLRQEAILRGAKMKLEREGKVVSDFQRKARYISEHNLMDKKL